MLEEQHKMIGSRDLIEFEFDLSAASSEQASLAWGEGIVRVSGEDYWYSEDTAGERSPVIWSWIDLLEFLGRSWPALLLEEVYPLGANPATPLMLRPILAARWENFVRDVVLEEDEVIYKFEGRHDFARGMKGIHLPALTILRQGELAWLSTESESRLVSHRDLIAILAEAGDYLAGYLAHANHGRAKHACRLWHHRAEKVRGSFVALRSGLADDVISLLQGEELPEVFWEVSVEDDYADSEILAAARMSGSVAGAEAQRTLFAKIKTIPRQAAGPLQRMTEECACELDLDGKVSYEDGYRLARWLRGKLRVAVSEAIDPLAILRSWDIPTEAIELKHCRIDAVACWGNNHGPAVLVNVGEGSRAVHVFGERSTLAHEICHLLVDRGRVLPAAEVLGGLTPKRIEQKANAFAAELLLPQESVGEYIKRHADVAIAIESLIDHFQVSAQLVGWQIKNSGLYQTLQAAEKGYVNQITSDVEVV